MASRKQIDGYASLAEVITEVKDRIIIRLSDVLPPVTGKLKKILAPNPEGVYLPWEAKPIIDFSDHDKVYYFAESHDSGEKLPIYCFADFMLAKSKGYGVWCLSSSTGKVRFVNMNLLYKNQYVSAEDYPFNVQLIRIAPAFLHRLLACCVSNANYQITGEIDLDHQDLEALNAICEGTDGLVNARYTIRRFAEEHEYAMYSIWRKNAMTITIDRHNDYRIISYYRSIFDSINDVFGEELAKDNPKVMKLELVSTDKPKSYADYSKNALMKVNNPSLIRPTAMRKKDKFKVDDVLEEMDAKADRRAKMVRLA